MAILKNFMMRSHTRDLYDLKAENRVSQHVFKNISSNQVSDSYNNLTDSKSAGSINNFKSAS